MSSKARASATAKQQQQTASPVKQQSAKTHAGNKIDGKRFSIFVLNECLLLL